MKDKTTWQDKLKGMNEGDLGLLFEVSGVNIFRLIIIQSGGSVAIVEHMSLMSHIDNNFNWIGNMEGIEEDYGED